MSHLEVFLKDVCDVSFYFQITLHISTVWTVCEKCVVN